MTSSDESYGSEDSETDNEIEVILLLLLSLIDL